MENRSSDEREGTTVALRIKQHGVRRDAELQLCFGQSLDSGRPGWAEAVCLNALELRLSAQGHEHRGA
jgi:hypothetical protein